MFVDRGWHHVFGIGILASGVYLANAGYKADSWPEVIGGLYACTYSLLFGAGIEFRRGQDKLMERDCLAPAVTPVQIHQPQDEPRVTTGNINIPVESGEMQPMYHTTRPATLQLKQTRQGWSIKGLGKRKHQLTAVMVEQQHKAESPYAKPDSEMLVAGRLIVQRNNNLLVDLRESYWVKGKHWPESADKFRRMLTKWTYHGMIERQGTNGNSTYVVTNWKKMRGVSNGVTLPPPPAEFKS
jgi:hypothetical protein